MATETPKSNIRYNTDSSVTTPEGEIKRAAAHEWTKIQGNLYDALRAYNSTQASEYAPTYATFSGHDMVVIFEIPIQGGPSISQVIGSLQTITYSVHEEKYPARGIGDMNAKGYVFGPRTVAGTMIFTVFNRHWARDMMDKYLETVGMSAHWLADELPPMNVTVSMANEYGQRARLAIFGVTFVNEGQVMSINDNYTENTFEFYAMDIDYLDSENDTEAQKIEKKKRITKRQLNGKLLSMLPASLRNIGTVQDIVKELSDDAGEGIVDAFGLKKIPDPLDLKPVFDKLNSDYPIAGEIAKFLVDDPKVLKKLDKEVQEYARLHPEPDSVDPEKDKRGLFDSLKVVKDAAKNVAAEMWKHDGAATREISEEEKKTMNKLFGYNEDGGDS